MGSTLEPVYIMMKKKMPVRYRRDRPGLSCMMWYSTVATFSTSTGSKVNSNWKEEQNTLIAWGTGLHTIREQVHFEMFALKQTVYFSAITLH